MADNQPTEAPQPKPNIQVRQRIKLELRDAVGRYAGTATYVLVEIMTSDGQVIRAPQSTSRIVAPNGMPFRMS